MSYDEKRKNEIARTMSINEAVQKRIDEENLRKLYMSRINELFYKEGYRSEAYTLEDAYASLNDLVQKYVAEGFDADRLFLAIRRGFEQKEKEKGKSR